MMRLLADAHGAVPTSTKSLAFVQSGTDTFVCKTLSSPVVEYSPFNPRDLPTSDLSVVQPHRISEMPSTIAGVKIPDSKMARDLTQLIRDTESDLLFHHSTRVYLFGALTGQRKGLKCDPELLYVGALFHDMGLTEAYRHSQLRFEVDSANAARDFLRGYDIPEASVEIVWDAIALHTTPGIPEHKKPEVGLVASGVEMDVVGIAYRQFTDEQREAVVA